MIALLAAASSVSAARITEAPDWSHDALWYQILIE